MNKLMMMFILLFVSSGLAFANQAKFDSAEVKVVYEEEEEHEDEDEDHEDDDHEDDDDHEEFNEDEFKAFLKEHFGLLNNCGKLQTKMIVRTLLKKWKNSI